MNALARELYDAYCSGTPVPVAPSRRDPAFDLDAAYAVEAELVRMRRTAGHRAVGRKVGFASKAVWRSLKLETVVWAHLYDDTVHEAPTGQASIALPRWYAPKIEPEIVFKLSDGVTRLDESTSADASAALGAVEWMALGFEIIDCPFPDWKFQPVDFLAAFGLHAALIVGEPRRIERDQIPALVERLSRFKVSLLKNGNLVAEGSGRNVLRSPALCFAELAAAVKRRPGSEPLAPGELVSTGTLTESTLIGHGETWSARVDELDLPELIVEIS